MNTQSKVWCIAYLDAKYLTLLHHELSRDPSFKEVEVFIPTVKVLKKTHKDKDHFEEQLMLFNYGFFQIPIAKATDPGFLYNLRSKVSCLYGWVKNPSSKKLFAIGLDEDMEVIEKPIPVALASDAEIAQLAKTSKDFGVHSQEEIAELNAGQVIQLKGYPFEGLFAEIIEIDPKKKKVKAKLLLDGLFRNVVVDFQNIIYTVYSHSEEDSLGHVEYRESLTTQSTNNLTVDL